MREPTNTPDPAGPKNRFRFIARKEAGNRTKPEAWAVYERIGRGKIALRYRAQSREDARQEAARRNIGDRDSIEDLKSIISRTTARDLHFHTDMDGGKILASIIDEAFARHWQMRVYHRGEWATDRTRDPHIIAEAIQAAEISVVGFYNDAGRIGSITVVRDTEPRPREGDEP